MKKFFITFLLICLAAVLGFAHEYEVIDFTISNVNTNTTAKTHTLKGITGKAISFSYYCSTGVVCTLASVDEYGLSLDAAKNIYHFTSTNASAQTNISSTVYLGNDRLTLSAHSSQGVGTEDIRARLLIER